MNTNAEISIQDQLKGWFAGYKIKRVSNHLNRVVIGETTTLTSFKKFLGFKVSKKFEVTPIEIEFTESVEAIRSFYNIHHGVVRETYDIECAIDETNKSVYWKGELVERKLQYENL
ncbi:hypothetical protein AAXB25_15015 [Paenibacillus lautus]|uniref:hypothetical protein n=1 Tax=Paenibacillus lautus TaxID=1401 RepID=UPI003D2C4E0B